MRIVHIPAPQPAPRVWLEAPASSTSLRHAAAAHLRRGPLGTLHYPELNYRIDPHLDSARESVRPQVELHYARCRCPACGERVHPVEVIRGHPTREVSVLAAIGEVVLGGCVFGDEPNHPDCPQCRASIPGRRL